MSTPSFFERYPIGSTAYVERRIHIQGLPEIHLAPVLVASHGRKYLVTDTAQKWQHYPGMDWLTAMGGTEAATGVGWRLFHDSPEIQVRLERERILCEEARQAREISDQIQDDSARGVADEPTCQRLVQTLIQRGHLTWANLITSYGHRARFLSLEDLLSVVDPSGMRTSPKP